ncbi:cytochrome P450 [Biscogniauxia marginata]|nr:cytochrome P450 [Biscogniauxia marginata]
MVSSARDISSLGPLNIIKVLGALFTLWYIYTTIAAWYRLRHIPGPYLARFSSLWLAVTIFTGKVDRFNKLQKYGRIVRISPTHVMTDDPAVLRQIAIARTRYTKDAWYLAAKFRPEDDSMITVLENRPHDIVKAKTAIGYSGRENPDLEPAIDEIINHLVDTIRSKHLTKDLSLQPVEFAYMSRFFTTDIITRLGYGAAWGFLDADHSLYGYIEHIDSKLWLQSILISIPGMMTLFHSPLLSPFLPHRNDKKGIGKVMGVSQKLIEERFQQDVSHKRDMIQSFIRHGMTVEELKGEAMLQIIAGADTSANVLRGIIMYTMTTPRVYSRLKHEIRECLDRDEASSPITFEQAQKLPYLQAVFLEGFRLNAPVICGHYKLVPPEGDTLEGLFLPGGTAIGHNTYAMMRRKDIFGEDVNLFRPERFLECDEDKRIEMERTIDIVFGGGRWMCAGKAIAIMELNKVTFELFRHFDFQTINPSKPWEEWANFLIYHTNMWVRITEAEL